MHVRDRHREDPAPDCMRKPSAEAASESGRALGDRVIAPIDGRQQRVKMLLGPRGNSLRKNHQRLRRLRDRLADIR